MNSTVWLLKGYDQSCMAAGHRYRTLEFTETFLEDFVTRDFGASDRQRILRALRLLDTNERHPSLHVHELRGPLKGVWSASASDELRITFERLEEGRKLLLTCATTTSRSTPA